ncbi:MAG: hypothetical protein ACYDEX_04065 [Mobilitalea sp.]
MAKYAEKAHRDRLINYKTPGNVPQIRMQDSFHDNKQPFHAMSKFDRMSCDMILQCTTNYIWKGIIRGSYLERWYKWIWLVLTNEEENRFIINVMFCTMVIGKCGGIYGNDR